MKIPGFWHCHAVKAVILPDAPFDPVSNHGITDFSRYRNPYPGPVGLPALINQYKPGAVNRLPHGIKFQKFIPFANAVFFGKYKGLQRNDMAVNE